MKSLILSFIRLYQRTAPTRIRNSCRFEPSCSEYMIQAIQKYGLMKGGLRGAKRLGRCKIPNGGVDLP